MSVFLIICLLVLAISLNTSHILMKYRLNSTLPEDQRFSWWSRDFREVSDAYRKGFPDSVLPDIDQYGGYAIWAFFAVLVFLSLLSRS
jgi:hypothetical protein